MTSGHNGHLRFSSRLARTLGVFGIALLLLTALLPAATVSAQQKGGVRGASTPEPTESPASGVSLYPAALDGLGDLLQSPDGGSREGVPEQVVNDEYGYTIDYAAPWESYGTWDTDGVEQAYFTDPATDALVSVTAWEWTGDSTVEGTIAWWASPENLAGWMPDGQVLQVRTGDTTGAVVFYHPPTADYADPWIYVSQLHVYEGYAIEITYSSTAPVFANAYPSAGESVMVNGVPVVGIFAAVEVMASLPAE